MVRYASPQIVLNGALQSQRVCSGLILFAPQAMAQDDYEWDPEHGLHEEEWYDPSDWFNDWGYDAGVDYEDPYEYDYDWAWDYDYDPYDYDYDWDAYDYNYDAYDYEPDWDDYAYDPYDYDYDYAYDLYDDEPDWDNYNYDLYDDEPDYDNYDYNWDATLTGTVVGMQRVRSDEGRPESLRLKVRTDDGRTRTLHLGDRAYIEQYLPKISKNDEIKIRGRNVKVNGKRMFKAEQIRSQGETFNIPLYEYNRTILGELAGLKKATSDDGDVQAVVAEVKTRGGKTMNVLLGSPEDLRREGRNIRPGSRIQVDGWTRDVGGDTTFFVQDTQVLSTNR